MSEPIYYNRHDHETLNINPSDLEMLDERYVNTDEVNASRQIDNLYAKYVIMIDPNGYIQFPDGTQMITATSIVGLNNGFTGKNEFNDETKFVKIFIRESSTSSKMTNIWQNGNILVIDNNNLSSSIYWQVYTGSGIVKRLVYDTQGNLYGINYLTTTYLYTSSLNTTTFNIANFSISYNSANIVLENAENLGGIIFRTYGSNQSTTNQLLYDSSGYLSGMKRLVIGNSYMTQTGDYLDFVNVSSNTNLLFSGYRFFSNNSQTSLTLTANGDIGGARDIYCRKLNVNGSIIYFDTYNTTVTNTQMIGYVEQSSSNTKHTKITKDGTNGFLFIPQVESGKNFWNASITTGDNCIISQGANLTITIATALRSNGIVFKETSVTIYNPKIIGDMTFEDGTIQTTAVNDTYINNLINAKAQMISYIPSSSIYSPCTAIASSSLNGFLFIPKIESGKTNWNASLTAGDNAIISNGTMTLTIMSSSSKVGITLSESGVKIRKAEVDENGLKFYDGSIQKVALKTMKDEITITSNAQNISAANTLTDTSAVNIYNFNVGSSNKVIAVNIPISVTNTFETPSFGSGGGAGQQTSVLISETLVRINYTIKKNTVLWRSGTAVSTTVLPAKVTIQRNYYVYTPSSYEIYFTNGVIEFTPDGPALYSVYISLTYLNAVSNNLNITQNHGFTIGTTVSNQTTNSVSSLSIIKYYSGSYSDMTYDLNKIIPSAFVDSNDCINCSEVIASRIFCKSNVVVSNGFIDSLGYLCRPGISGVVANWRTNFRGFGNQFNSWWTGSTLQFYVNDYNVGNFASCDYRLKDNVTQSNNVLERLCDIEMFDYEYKDIGIYHNNGKHLGCFAHELQEKFIEYPNLVIGEKDDVNENGDIKPQTISQELIFILMKSIQELTKRVEELENELKNKK